MNNSNKKKASGSNDKLLPSHKDESGFAKTFPQRLFELLSSVEDSSQSITWTPTGDAFMIVDQVAFVDNVLPIFFKRTKFTSFKGKLYRWGFRRVSKGANAGAYFHKLFMKDNPALCLHMRRQMKRINAAAAVEDIPTPKEAASGPFTSTVGPRKSKKKRQSKPKNDTKSNVLTPVLLPQAHEAMDVSQLESGAFSALSYPTVCQLPNPGLSRADMLNSVFDSSNKSSLAQLKAQVFANMLRFAHQNQVTKTLVEEGERRIDDVDYVNKFSMQSPSFVNQYSDTMMTQIGSRLSSSKLNEGQQNNSLRKFCSQSNINATSARPSPSLLVLHKNIQKRLMMVPLTSNMTASNPVTSHYYPHEQRSDRSYYHLNTTQALNEFQGYPHVSSQERPSNGENSSKLSSAMSQQQNQGALPSDWSSCDGSTHSSNSTKLDLLSNAALSFRTPSLQEYPTMNESMQDIGAKSVIVVNGKLTLATPLPRPGSAYRVKGQTV